MLGISNVKVAACVFVARDEGELSPGCLRSAGWTLLRRRVTQWSGYTGWAKQPIRRGEKRHKALAVYKTTWLRECTSDLECQLNTGVRLKLTKPVGAAVMCICTKHSVLLESLTAK